MDLRPEKLEAVVGRLDGLVAGVLPQVAPPNRPAIERWRADADALRYHLGRLPGGSPAIVGMIGGTGTGKSTIVNRVLGETISATSFRRTYTAGAVAVTADKQNLPPRWLGLEHVLADARDLPARGQTGALVMAELKVDLTQSISLIDTPDLDGDQPAHHAEADRVFRWADAVLFLVTPEKYQMTEVLPYYRLAARYQVPALFVMNKCEQQAVADDYQQLLKSHAALPEEDRLFVIPRDDAGYEPPPGQNLNSLREALTKLTIVAPADRAVGLRNRGDDLLGRLNDQVITPLRETRREMDRLAQSLRGMEAPVPGVDVNPLTQELQRRMQQRSVLYLMGPQRILDRVRQAPTLLIRLPRLTWDFIMHGSASVGGPQAGGSDPQRAPDFKAILSDQFAVLQSRLDDTLRASPVLKQWVGDQSSPAYKSALIDPAEAGKIAEEELAELKRWLEQRWNSTPRDTRILESLLKFLPGGKKITQWTEAAPYLLVIIAAASHTLFHGVDLAVIGGWSLATWIGERLSNEVTSHTRQTNQQITERFAKLAHEQIEQLCRWLDQQAPKTKSLDQLDSAVDEARAMFRSGR